MADLSLNQKLRNTLSELWYSIYDSDIEAVRSGLQSARNISSSIEEEDGALDIGAVEACYASPVYGSFKEEIDHIVREGGANLEAAELTDAVRGMTEEETEEFLISEMDNGSETAGAMLAEMRGARDGYRIRTGARCPRCGAPLYQEVHVPGYQHVCLVCEENFCGFEVS